MTSACDVRLCSNDAFFSIKEVDIGLAADVGTLQRFPKLVGNDSLVRELCFTARVMPSSEALQIGFVSHVLPDRQSCINSAIEMAVVIASKSPIAILGSKLSLNYSREHTAADGLRHVRIWNSAMLQGEDVKSCVVAAFSVPKQLPLFSKL
jgi:delta(3,5)-delta(2,4)-dienoyl-CoA isomerase